MSYSVEYKIDMGSLPDDMRRQIEKTMNEIAEAVSTVSASSPFWASARDSVLQIDVEGFRLSYRVFRQRAEIVVIEAQRMR